MMRAPTGWSTSGRTRGERGGACSTAARRRAGGTSSRVADRALPVRRSARCRTRAARTPSRLAAAGRHHAQQPARARRALPARAADRRDRRVGLGQVQPGEPGAAGTGGAAPGHERRTPRKTADEAAYEPRARRHAAGRMPAHGRRSAGWCRWTRSRSAARRAPTWPPTPACSTTCASCSPRRRPRAPGATTRAASPSTWPRAAATPARAKASCQVELLFMPSVYAPCPTCHGARYNEQTLEITLERTRTSPRCWDDGGGGLRPSSPMSRRAAAAAGAARHRPGLPAPGPAGHRAVGRRSAAHQAGHRTAAQPSAATRCMCWTSRPPACTRPTWTS
jgi:hypothetical protein